MAEPAIEFASLTKRFGATVAVDALTLTVPRGAMLGLLGRNGAGKTTSISVATGVLRPTAGSVRVLGMDVEQRPLEVKRRIGVMPQDDALLENLTGPQYLQFVGRMYALDYPIIASRSLEIFETLDLTPADGTLVREYSYGMRKKLALGAALLHGPEVLFLDEPFEGIDPVTSRTIREILAAVRKKGATIVMSSHVLEIVERICETVAIMEKGALVAHGTVDELCRRDAGAASLEEVFVGLMGGSRPGDLSWL
jgi:ABC-2 type transport system ATP-binding protein